MAFIQLTAVYVMKWDLCGTQKTRFDSSFFFKKNLSFQRYSVVCIIMSQHYHRFSLYTLPL